jgi:hypothetical protein
MAHAVVNEVDAVPVLQSSVHRAQEVLLSGSLEPERVNKVLATLAAELAPAFPYLNAIAAAQPRSPVPAVLTQLNDSFTHAAAGRSDHAVTSLVTASTTAYRLADDAALDAAERADPGHWR